MVDYDDLKGDRVGGDDLEECEDYDDFNGDSVDSDDVGEW